MTCVRGTSASRRRKSSMNSAERCWRRMMPRTVPVCTSKAASRSAVPWRTYSNSRRAGWPGAAGWLGAQGVRTPMPLSHQGNKPVGGLLWHYKDVDDPVAPKEPPDDHRTTACPDLADPVHDHGGH